jgi:hypothetical protein
MEVLPTVGLPTEVLRMVNRDTLAMVNSRVVPVMVDRRIADLLTVGLLSQAGRKTMREFWTWKGGSDEMSTDVRLPWKHLRS